MFFPSFGFRLKKLVHLPALTLGYAVVLNDYSTHAVVLTESMWNSDISGAYSGTPPYSRDCLHPSQCRTIFALCFMGFCVHIEFIHHDNIPSTDCSPLQQVRAPGRSEFIRDSSTIYGYCFDMSFTIS